MTDTADLERRYRHWLRWYPAWFRREHEAEILGMAPSESGFQPWAAEDIASS